MDKDRHYLRVKGCKTIFQANGPKKQAGIAILISNKINFQTKVIKKDREGYFILIKSKIFQDELTILNIYAPNARSSTFIKETIVKLKAHIAKTKVWILRFFLKWRIKYPWKELQRQSSELRHKKGPSRDCPIWGTIP
jgi:exonuclease III